LLKWEFDGIKDKVVAAQNELKSQPDNYVSELLHQTAYHNNTLGNSLLSTPITLRSVDENQVRNHLLQHFSLDKMVFVGVNVDHDDICKWMMRSFVDYNPIPPMDSEVKAAKYTGGYRRIGTDMAQCHMAVGFHIEGGFNGPDALAVSLLQTILGNSETVLSKLFDRHPNVESSMAFSHLYSDSGILGVYAMMEPSHAADFVQDTAALLRNISISSGDISRGKEALKLESAQGFEDCHSLVDELGTQLMLGGKIATADQIMNLIDQITESDVTRALQSALTSKPTVVAYGNVGYVPHYDDVVAAFTTGRLNTSNTSSSRQEKPRVKASSLFDAFTSTEPEVEVESSEKMTEPEAEAGSSKKRKKAK